MKHAEIINVIERSFNEMRIERNTVKVLTWKKKCVGIDASGKEIFERTPDLITHVSDFDMIREFLKKGEALKAAYTIDIESSSLKGNFNSVIERSYNIQALMQKCNIALTVYSQAVANNGYKKPEIPNLKYWSAEDYIDFFEEVVEIEDRFKNKPESFEASENFIKKLLKKVV